MEKLLFLVFVAGYSFLLFEGSFMTDDIWNMISSSQILLLVLNRVP